MSKEEIDIDLQAESEKAKLERKRRLNNKVQAWLMLFVLILFGIIWFFKGS